MLRQIQKYRPIEVNQTGRNRVDQHTAKWRGQLARIVHIAALVAITRADCLGQRAAGRRSHPRPASFYIAVSRGLPTLCPPLRRKIPRTSASLVLPLTVISTPPRVRCSP